MLAIAFHTITAGCSLLKTIMVAVIVLTDSKGPGGMAVVTTPTLTVFIQQLLMVKVLSGTVGKVIIIP